MDRRILRFLVAPTVAIACGLGVTVLATWPLVISCADIPIGGHPRECFSVGDVEVIPPIEPWRLVIDWGPWGFGPTLAIFVIVTASVYLILVAVASRRLSSRDWRR
jgi:hypothetical protein